MAFVRKIQRSDLFNLFRNFGIKKIFIFVILFFSAGCTSTPFISSRITQTLVPTGTKYVFPATWTQLPSTNTSMLTGTPSPTASPTITPTETNTPFSTSSTEMDEEPSSTPDWGSAQSLDCTFTASDTGMRIYTAPFIDPYRVLPTMEPGKPYPAVLTKPTYTLLLENGEPLGWIDYRSLAVNSNGKECLTGQDQREITDFPSLCFLTPLTEIAGYSNSALTEQLVTLSPSTSMVVLRQSNDSYFTAFGSSGPSFLVKRDEVFIHGNCDSIPTAAEAIVETSLYSTPPDQGGSIIYTLTIGEPIYSQSKTLQSGPPPGVEGSGHWILVRRHSWSEDINGWIWSEHLTYE